MTSTLTGPALALVPSAEERSLRETVYALTATFGPDYYAKVTAEHSSPHELWDALGVEDTVKRINGEGRPIPANVERMLGSDPKSFYRPADRACAA